MRRFVRLVVAGLLATSGLVTVAAGSAHADPVVAERCNDNGIGNTGQHNPGVTIPSAGTPLDGVSVLGSEDPCAEFLRTLVFVGEAVISNGVSFAGTGAPSSNGHAGGGTYLYTGVCLLVNWEKPEASAAPVVAGVTTCSFDTTNGVYGEPVQGTPVVNQAGAAIEAGTPGYTGLDWAPSDQASCTSSGGSGVSTFTATPNPDLGGTATDKWSSSYHWDSGLTNLRGEVWKGVTRPTDTSKIFGFDAKIHGDAHPDGLLNGDTTAGIPEGTAGACVQKTQAAATGGFTVPNNDRLGINNVLIVGTASWKSAIPSVL